MTIFEKIIARQIPTRVVYEDDDLIAFHDVDPKAPVHVLIVPKRVIARIGAAETNDALLLGKLLPGCTNRRRANGRGSIRLPAGDQPRTGFWRECATFTRSSFGRSATRLAAGISHRPKTEIGLRTYPQSVSRGRYPYPSGKDKLALTSSRARSGCV